MKKTGITIVAALALLAPFAKADVIGPGITTFAGGGLIILAGAAAVILIVAIRTAHQDDAAIWHKHAAVTVSCRPPGTCVNLRPISAVIR